MKKKKKDIKEIYYNFAPDIDTKAVDSKLRIQREWHKEKLNIVLEHLDLNNKRILDLGCGSGGITFKLFKRIKNSEVVGLDFNEKAIELANRRVKKEKLKRLKFISGDAENIPFEDNEFDAVIALDMLDHMFTPKKCLKDIRRVLNKNGKAMIGVGNYKSLWPIIEKLWDKFGDGRNYEETHLHHFDNKSFMSALKKAGFKDIKVLTTHNMAIFIKAIANFPYPKSIENFMKNNKLGMTLFCIVDK